MHEMWVIYDSANETYLTGGNWRALEYARTKNPLEAHRYPHESTAVKMLKRLHGEITKANQQTEWHLLPIWNPAERKRRAKHGHDDETEVSVKVQPILEIHHVYSPQIRMVDLSCRVIDDGSIN